jgi:hypothetical protein
VGDGAKIYRTIKINRERKEKKEEGRQEGGQKVAGVHEERSTSKEKETVRACSTEWKGKEKAIRSGDE